MVKGNYIVPQLGLVAFNCPFCGAYSHQQWDEIEDRPVSFREPEGIYTSNLYEDRVEIIKEGSASSHVCSISKCMHCSKFAIWVETTMVYPDNVSVEPATADMPEDI